VLSGLRPYARQEPPTATFRRLDGEAIKSPWNGGRRERCDSLAAGRRRERGRGRHRRVRPLTRSRFLGGLSRLGRRSGPWSRLGSGDRRGGRGAGRRRGAAWGQKPQRVDIAVRFRGDTDPEVDVRLGVLDVAARADRPDVNARRDGIALAYADRAEVDERRGVAVGRLDRDGAPAPWNGSGECHSPARRRDDRSAGRSADVDAAVLPGGVRVRPENERS
jgi:hypothetical protein